MALNFRIYETKHDADLFLADQLRKQISLNPDSTLVLDLNDTLDNAYDYLIGEVNNHPVNLANVKLLLANGDGGAKFNALDIPEQQIRNVKSDDDLNRYLDKKEKVNVAVLNLDHEFKGFKSGSSDDLFKAKELFIYASGSGASETVRKLYDADMSKDSPLSKVKNHRMVTVILDAEAASKLDRDIREFYTYKFA
ncbi:MULTISPECIES: hypothetical protein [Nosocomiicoccus]|uniref:Glucosamine-6-phosphate isomerase n=1 Tax=Nosocomiicoccus massiliensis TaxID=1232430 RepID=A0AAF1BVW5_9STAP|nr:MULTISPECIES: hypothetical protein [Nosocomiicoccus]MDK6863520.1 hypothetical protein [Nosocomiicoccus ampullae]OFL46382.1 hypothetical protein HMPREF2767_05635 [Nosocomiicoccus sp. HMSC067E10]WOS96816.1 hypothetical protein CJ229_003515 [Nosocomiicoccus massiliensis]